MSDTTPTSGADKQSIDNLWGEAMSEQQTADNMPAKENLVPNFSEDLDLILDIPVKMTVELGRTKMTIKELLRLVRDLLFLWKDWPVNLWIFSSMAT